MEAQALLENSEESSSSEEDEDEGIIDDQTEMKIFETLLKIRNKDESIYNKDVKFFESESEENEAGEVKVDAASSGRKDSKKDKPMYLKDMVFREALETAENGAMSDSDDEGAIDNHQALPGSYVEEQTKLKHAFLSAVDSVDATLGTKVAPQKDDKDVEFGAGVLKKRHPRRAALADGDATEEFLSEKDGSSAAHERIQSLLNYYFDKREGNVSEDDQFLRTYILNKGWVDKDGGEENDLDDEATYRDGEGGEDVEIDEDEAAMEAAEAFEAQYNFRFQEPDGMELISHPRHIEGTIRKENDKRKRQRAEKEARKKAEQEAHVAEIRRLKNLKKAEIQQKLQELRSVAGSAAPEDHVLGQMLSGDFDPEAHDRMMASAFGTKYYEAGEDESEDDLLDEMFEKELEAISKYGSADDDVDVLRSTRSPAVPAEIRTKANLPEADQQDETVHDDEQRPGDTAEPNEKTVERTQEDVKRLLAEYHSLDFEDTVGGIKTRFRYKEVEPETYGMNIEEILQLDDKELNQIVGLKTVTATYRDRSRKIRPNYGKLNELRRARGVSNTDVKRFNDDKGWSTTTSSRHQHRRARDGVGEITHPSDRMASYEPLSLKKRGDGRLHRDEGQAKNSLKKEKKRKRSPSSHPDGDERTKSTDAPDPLQGRRPSKLTKSQRKNAKRTTRRAQNRAFKAQTS